MKKTENRGSYFWDFLRFLWQLMYKDPSLKKKRKIGPSRSIVRKIGSALPLSAAPRVPFTVHRYINNRSLNEVFSNVIDSDDGFESIPDSEGSESSELNAACQQEIQQLKNELQLLKLQVSCILEKQETDSTLSEGKKQKEGAQNYSQGIPAPPPLPPPPPPLPSALFTSTTPLNFSTKRSNITRSPGGRPVRATCPKTHPSDVLTEVLKKRFNALNMSDSNEVSVPSSPMSP